MIKNKSDQNITSPPEPGEKELAKLIKEAGKTARARKKKVMDEHFQRLRDAVNGASPSPRQNRPL